MWRRSVPEFGGEWSIMNLVREFWYYTRGIWPIHGAIQSVRTRFATWPRAASQNSEAAKAAPRARCTRSLSLRSAAVFGRNCLSIPSWVDRTRCVSCAAGGSQDSDEVRRKR